MHFVTGGAFNGKRSWVKERFANACWLSAYENAQLPTNLTDINSELLVLEGIEMWLKELSSQSDPAICRDIWRHTLAQWESWERANSQRQLIIIGTDITKGIVPMEEENRRWRDVTGWAYQDLAIMAKTVDVIWYGINQTIK
ncbi:bifunctional adenosylcobinamide kinase/adenosylcobinamide-phosphate guanylyltransferase [Neobacillus sp. OS1-32]|jgi:adenosylcobinamide kinase/adenosylcobinamide-phosphate guanylyltransferase|uniref:bifunctional adenosylcobinamide kinase/adenosylcobinamide-phosphate guanylyltransferase n=1 Tax=Neobacillus sp. OS1-32 TaxID=3070682 RepID=UPI0027E0E803|nr:bifunctional adenosylcobinamide kinase/adenosylcobinamide-phosphate guanylyltransferase [Neobacillus sp. OS1-32]WML31583.1 bifunctional adenosylcobinamide kinase/adenosylcobinamide-phosphate guanylyltransferase [Neobacillus sp. OS1-32]